MTIPWAVAHRMAMMAANHAHQDTGMARDDYVDVFTALRKAEICCIAKPLRGLAGAYADKNDGGPVVLLNSSLDEVTMRHTAGHELGHHVFGHNSREDRMADLDVASLGEPLPNEEKLAEAFAAWFLMPLPAVQSAMRRSGISKPRRPEDVHQVACWLGTSFAGTARQLGNLQLAHMQQAEEWTRAWHNGSARMRAALCGSRTPPPGRVWSIRSGAHGAYLHVLPGDTLVYPGGELPCALPPGLAVHSDDQLSLDSPMAVTITRALSQPCRLTVSESGTAIAVTLVPPPVRSGIDTTWRAPERSPALPREEQ